MKVKKLNFPLLSSPDVHISKQAINSFFSFNTFLILTAALSFLFFSCTTTKSLPHTDIDNNGKNYEKQPLLPPPDEIVWQEIRPGVKEFSYSIKRHTPSTKTHGPKGRLKCCLVEVDFEKIQQAGGTIDFFVKEPSPKEYWIKTESVKKFAGRTGSFLAVNTNPFHQKYRNNPFASAHIIGICVQNGKLLSEADEKYAALAFYRKNFSKKSLLQAKIFNSQKEVYQATDLGAFTKFTNENQSDYLECVSGGFWTILENGEIKAFKEIWDFRNAVGTKNDGKTVIFLSGGPLTFMESAEIFKALGADKAMQFDGGSPAALVVNGKLKPAAAFRRNTVGILGIKIQ
ncbi:MAG: phosphodiester glycosidase family protein [Treponema sp.]|nr:phosphodiester glycosidase family protein [Treponema sp.]